MCATLLNRRPPGRDTTYHDPEPEQRQADAVGHTHRRQKPDFGRRGALILDVARDLLGCLSLVHLSLDPLVKPAFFQGAIKANQELYVGTEAGLGEGGEVGQHVIPLAAAHPVGVEPPVQPVEAALRVQEQPERTLRRSLPATSNQRPSC